MRGTYDLSKNPFNTELKSTVVHEYKPPIKAKSTITGSILVSKTAIVISTTVGFLLIVGFIGTGLSLGFSKAYYNQACSSSKPCISSEETICEYDTKSSNGYICKCDTLKYWDNKKCLNKGTINSTCSSNDHCIDTQNLECINSACSCNSLRYWSVNDGCQPKKIYNESCSSSIECNDKDSLSCVSLKCNCNSTQFWNGNSCENKRVFNQTCSSNDWCNTQINRLTCIEQTWKQESSQGVCKCSSSQFYDTTTTSCVNLYTYGQTGCLSSLQCNYNVYLSCISGVCTCTSNEYYDGTQCRTKVGYLQTCHQSSFSGSLYPKCYDSLGLVCQSSSCRCNSTQFWSSLGSRCLNLLSVGSQCTATADCDSTKNLQCISGYCQCSSVQYYSSTGCVNKLSYGAICTSNIQCNNNSVLTCSSGQCLCVTSPHIYWSSTWSTCLKISSTILKPIEVDYLYTMLGVTSTHTLTLLYRASRDGMSSSAFHSICDGIPNTVTVISNSNNYVYGGFTATTWDTFSACKADSSAFIFNLRRNSVSNYDKIPVSISNCAIRAIGAYGPIFGYDDILVDYRVRFSFDGWCSYCNAYPCPSGISAGTSSYVYLCGGSAWGYYFGDYEVYRV